MAIFGNVNPVTGQTQIMDPLARTLIQQAQSQEPIVHPLQLAGRLAQLGAGTYRESRQNEGQAQAFSDVWKQSGGDLTKFAELARGNRYLRAMGPQLSMKLAEAQFKTAQDVEAEKRKSELRLKEMEDPRYLAAKRAGATRVSTNITNMAESEFQKQRAKDDAEFLKKLREDARASTSTLGQLKEAESLLSKVTTGKLARTSLTIGQYAKAMGVKIPGGMNPDQVATAEALDALSKQMMLPIAKALGANPTDRDAQIIMDSQPSLSKTPEGNLKLIQMMRDYHTKRVVEYRDAHKAYETGKGIPSDFYLKRLPKPEEAAPTGAPPAASPTGNRQMRTVIGPDGKPRNVYTDGKQWFNEDGTPLK